MLFNKFYTVSGQEHTTGTLKAHLAFNKDHDIFKGHFPGHPVVPGVCMLQIVREVMEIQTNRKLKIDSAFNMKFMAVINPEENKDVDISVTYTTEDGKFIVNATLSAGEVVFFKLIKGQLLTA